MVLSSIFPILFLFAPQHPVESLKEELKRGEKLLQRKEEEYQRLSRELDDALSRKQLLKERLEKLTREQSRLVEELETISREKARQKELLEKERLRLEGTLALAYSFFAGDVLEHLLKFGDVSEVIRVRGALRLVSQNIRSRVEETQRTLSVLQQREVELSRLSQEHKRVSQELEEDGKKLKALEEELLKNIAALKKELEFRRRYVSELRGELKYLLKELGPEHPALLGRKLIAPVQAPLLLPYGKVVDPVFRVEIFHPGWTYRVPQGTPVRAAAAGVVIYYGWVRGYGNLLILKHSGGWYTLYGHLMKSAVALGDEVQEGQIIALSGDSGSLYGPVLHFGVRKGKEPLNPGILIRSQ